MPDVGNFFQPGLVGVETLPSSVKAINHQDMQRVMFGDIAAVAQEENRRIFGPPPEPVEIQIQRFQAAEEAQQLMAEAYAQAELVREEARQEGYDEGYLAGQLAGAQAAKVQGEQEREAYRADIVDFIAHIEVERQRIWQEAEPQIMAFVLEIAQKVVKNEVQVNREAALSVTRNALRRVVDKENIRIRVNALDLETLRAAREDLLSLVDGMRHIEIVEDRRVDAGGCIVETNAGMIDAKVDTQLAEVNTLLETMMREAA